MVLDRENQRSQIYQLTYQPYSLESIDADAQIYVILTDLQKTFHTVNHNISLIKLKNNGVFDSLYYLGLNQILVLVFKL